MISLNLIAAAKLLRMHKDTLAGRARANLIPGVKNGRSWCFLEDDLITHMRSQYGQPKLPTEPCPSTVAQSPKFGGLTSPTLACLDYVSQLERRIALRRKKSTTG